MVLYEPALERPVFEDRRGHEEYHAPALAQHLEALDDEPLG